MSNPLISNMERIYPGRVFLECSSHPKNMCALWI
ncbi:hypothetical protein F383_29276 [Gossypium arboreum]|uniref:Uncharacterized protein n=1 Tax=Gossypium arboreum TaxID=29729 RepID=A0A0B0PCN1_GOSAR|nr:hypothetical protein F383_29276 [Gossypium arboreum]